MKRILVILAIAVACFLIGYRFGDRRSPLQKAADDKCPHGYYAVGVDEQTPNGLACRPR
jgi:hypothetical protein